MLKKLDGETPAVDEDCACLETAVGAGSDTSFALIYLLSR